MYVLQLNCVDKPGIVAAVATTLRDTNCNIEESAQFNEPFSGQFFMRVVFSPLSQEAEKRFQNVIEQKIAPEFQMKWSITPLDKPVPAILMVSKDDHCLNDILYRWRTGHLLIDIKAIISNHENCRALAEDRNIPFYFLPVTKETKQEQEQKVFDIIDKTKTELIVMARYMQILSKEFCERYAGHVINIHHSFLPGFKGAKPYHQAYERGVKIVGATAHFATPDLDEGPIIEQETVRIDHTYGPKKLQLLGRDTEARVLSRAIQLYTEQRIFLHENRTVIL